MYQPTTGGRPVRLVRQLVQAADAGAAGRLVARTGDRIASRVRTTPSPRPAIACSSTRRSIGSCGRTWRSAGRATSTCRRARCSRAASRRTSTTAVRSQLARQRRLRVHRRRVPRLRGVAWRESCAATRPSSRRATRSTCGPATTGRTGSASTSAPATSGRTFADNGNTFEVDGYGVLNLACALSARPARVRAEHQQRHGHRVLRAAPGLPAGLSGQARERARHRPRAPEVVP